MPIPVEEAADRTVRGLLVIGGSGPSPAVLRSCGHGSRLIVAADSGLDRCREAGITPDLVVGDMDSVSDGALLEGFAPDRVMRFPRDKDETDTEIGVRILRERGCSHVTIAGGAGGRIDHLLAVAALFERDPAPSRWVTDAEDMWLVEKEAAWTGCRGSTISIFPLGERAASLHSEGLKWPLDGLDLRRGYPGVSNRATADTVRITVGIGKILVVHSFLLES